jgi:hypothetical protein
MFNSIDINREGNSISTLNLYWLAMFKDGSSIPQFEEDGLEHRFQEVKDKFNELEYFILYHKFYKDIQYIVDLEKGLIFIKKLQVVDNDLLKENKTNVRLIFFRRHTVNMNENFKETGHNINYFIGFQYLDKQGNNKQILLQIDLDGQCIIGE